MPFDDSRHSMPDRPDDDGDAPTLIYDLLRAPSVDDRDASASIDFQGERSQPLVVATQSPVQDASPPDTAPFPQVELSAAPAPAPSTLTLDDDVTAAEAAAALPIELILKYITARPRLCV